MRVLSHDEMQEVAGGWWSCWSWRNWCKPSTPSCTPKPCTSDKSSSSCDDTNTTPTPP